MSTDQRFSKPIPEEGIEVVAARGNKFTRINLDLAADGITLALVGAASALKGENRHSLRLTPGKEGVTLAMVGAAAALK